MSRVGENKLYTSYPQKNVDNLTARKGEFEEKLGMNVQISLSYPQFYPHCKNFSG